SASSVRHRGRQPFPTRRSSDLREERVVIEHLLEVRDEPARIGRVPMEAAAHVIVYPSCGHSNERLVRHMKRRRVPCPCGVAQERSEEHTSELQSQSNLVCHLLL